jgi:glutamyl-tRNA synthetase
MIKTRFAPSPTGFLHVGNLRTALYSYLFAKQNGGKFLLRIEDTDRERFVEGGLEAILKSLYWTKIVPDEGVVLTENNKITQVGNNGPYIQSERLDIYKKYIEELIKIGGAYRCFCTKERLDEVKKTQQANNQPTGYDGCCRNLSAEEIKLKLDAKEKHVIRMKMPKTGETVFKDLIRGEVSFRNELIDDQVILKSDGFPTYHFAVVIDDHLMEITHIIRGEEWISSVPKHIQLYNYFGWQIPQMAHLPLFLNADKSKLSKRQGDVSVGDYINKGYLPEAMINFMAMLGWNPGNDCELFSLEELVKEFKIENVSKAGAVFNLEKLNWFNQQYIKMMDLTELTLKSLPFLENNNLVNEKLDVNNEKFEWIKKIITLEKERISTLSELPEAVKFIFKLPDFETKLLIWKKSTLEITKNNLQKLEECLKAIGADDWNLAKLSERVGEWIKENNLTNGEVLWPMRVALSGQQNSPGPYEIADVLGKDESLTRIKKAISKIVDK